LIYVWTLVWYFAREGTISSTAQFWVIGLVLTGLTLVTLGLMLGRLGQTARAAELPPATALQAEKEIQKIAAAAINPNLAQAATPSQPTIPMPVVPAAPTPTFAH
jgi:hypothetical protein